MKPKGVDTAGRIEAALRHPDLGDRERVTLAGYLHFEARQGGACGAPGLCWPSDAELGAYLGRSEISVRRARKCLSDPKRLGGPLVRVTYVRPFGRLPDGSVAMHGANVVKLAIASPAATAAAHAHAEAITEVQERARELELARARARALADAIAETSDYARPGNDSSSHNVSSTLTLGRSPVRARAERRGGGGARRPIAA